MVTKQRKAVPPPRQRCEDCKELKPAFGFVNLTAEDGTSRVLCPACYYRDSAQVAGLPEIEIAELEPIERFDWLGKAHTFYFGFILTTGLGIRAAEWFKDGPGGYEFMVLEHPDTPVREAYDKLVRKIEAGLAEGYMEASDYPGVASENRLHIRGSAVNGRIDESGKGEPRVVVDGREYSWTEFGRMLSRFTGFNFRLECFDICDEPEIAANPKRPEKLWWLDLPEHEAKDRSHH